MWSFCKLVTALHVYEYICRLQGWYFLTVLLQLWSISDVWSCSYQVVDFLENWLGRSAPWFISFLCIISPGHPIIESLNSWICEFWTNANIQCCISKATKLVVIEVVYMVLWWLAKYPNPYYGPYPPISNLQKSTCFTVARVLTCPLEGSSKRSWWTHPDFVAGWLQRCESLAVHECECRTCRSYWESILIKTSNMW